MTIIEAGAVLINRAIKELKAKGKEVNKETLFTNKAYALYFLKMLVKTDNDLPIQGFFQQTNKEVLIKYKSATTLLKRKLKNNLNG